MSAKKYWYQRISTALINQQSSSESLQKKIYKKKLKSKEMNLESMPRPETIHVSAPAALSRPLLSSQTMPQRSPFAIQELLGLSDSGRPSGAVSAVTPSLYPSVGQTPFSSDHHQMTMHAASRMAYFNAHAAVAAAFMPHNMAGASPHLNFHSQASGELIWLIIYLLL